MSKEDQRCLHNQKWYKKTYDNLIIKCLGKIYSGDIYTEIHHIIPKCMGGSNEKDNLVRMSAREHIMAHLLLAEIYPDNRGIISSAECMFLLKGNNVDRDSSIKTFSLRTASRARESAACWRSGENHPFFGKKHTLDSRKKMSDKLKGNKHPFFGKKLSEEHVNNISISKKGDKNPMYGKNFTAEHRKHLSDSRTGEKHPFFGKKFTEEHREKLSTAARGKKKTLSDEERTRRSNCIKGVNNPNYNRVISEEEKLRRREKMAGKYCGSNNASAKKIQGPDGTVYGCVKDAYENIGVDKSTFHRWLKNKPEKGYRYLD